LSGAARDDRVERALDALDRNLVDADGALIRLLEPPFDTAEPDPGYIRGYVPGVRENGGQYTHAAAWAVMAFFAAGRTERGWQLFDMINPVRHAQTPDDVDRYKVEPYVLAADVLAVAPHVGRGGWTWYTGSAAWMYRLITESMLGLSRRGQRLLVQPRLPEKWATIEIDYRFGEAIYRIRVLRSEQEVGKIEVDGVAQDDMSLALFGEPAVHEVLVWIARQDSSLRRPSRPQGEVSA